MIEYQVSKDVESRIEEDGSQVRIETCYVDTVYRAGPSDTCHRFSVEELVRSIVASDGDVIHRELLGIDIFVYEVPRVNFIKLDIKLV